MGEGRERALLRVIPGWGWVTFDSEFFLKVRKENFTLSQLEGLFETTSTLLGCC